MINEDLKQLRFLSAEVGRMKERLQRLRASAGVRSPKFDGMPRGGSGPTDRVAEIAVAIADTESELMDLENQHEQIRAQVAAWIDKQEDLKAGVILSCRFLDQMTWEQVANEITNCEGEAASADSVRKYALRHLDKETKSTARNDR